MSTLLLTRSEIETLLDPITLLAGLRRAFVAYSTDSAGRAHRVRSQLPGPGTATVLFPGTTPGVPAYTVKVHAKFPAQSPAIRGVLCLHDVETGSLLAVMDSTHLTAVRTGLAGALAADVLANASADTAAVIGAGVQGLRPGSEAGQLPEAGRRGRGQAARLTVTTTIVSSVDRFHSVG